MGMTHNSVTNQLELTINLIPKRVSHIPDSTFYTRKNDHWSPAEQVKHLELAVKPLILAYRLPSFFLRILFGKPNRASRSYDELLAKYHKKLSEGGKASSPFVPKMLKTDGDKQTVIDACIRKHHAMLHAAAKYADKDLDRYILPHPLLGKITLREMLFFTDFHIKHHLNSIEQLYMS
jgi:hypothetical protein